MFSISVQVPQNSVITIRDPLYEQADDIEYVAAQLTDRVEVYETLGKIMLFKESGELKEEIHQSHIDFLPLQRSHMVYILAVPIRIENIQIFLGSFVDDLSYLRILRTSTYYYSVVLVFQNQSSADKFYFQYNGKEFDECSYEYCYIVYLSGVNFCSLPMIFDDWKELPTCPVCIERLDVNISGITGVLRTEVAESMGSRWNGVLNECKVCRSVGNAGDLVLRLAKSASHEERCEDCEERTELWICLICGHLGCGRYKEAHGKVHFQITKHSFTLELATQRIWDYAGDNYVHRLVHSGPSLVIFDEELSDEPKEDLDRMIWEYNYLINSQLEQQRLLYESKIESKLEEKHSEISEQIKLAKAENERLKRLSSKIKGMEKKKQALIEKLKKITEENELQEEINRTLKISLKEESDEPVFLDKKSKATYLKLQRLRKEVEDIMQKLG
ncbi:unnamed protein product [Blepharisma stoltei]|uniref:UBP-type domain-containing protein n=1 Tax=Blepharisma stoltei TaxID=1481888 RepID=A0AAU9JS78_9CILI|nr:unnamed protein product [Blepharisma stoltei]